jgi:hypothetical protein
MAGLSDPSVSAALDPSTPYGLVRALLVARGAEDRGVQTGATYFKGWPGRDDQLWKQLAEETEYHGVTPLVAPMLLALGTGAVPQAARRMLMALVSRHRRASAAREACVDRLLTAFDAAGLPMLMLKGAALAHTLYPSPELRPSVDIDILIDPVDEGTAADVVRRLGYAFATRSPSKFAGRAHHLPVATMSHAGFPVALEIHRDAMSNDQSDSLTLPGLTEPPQVVDRGRRPPGLAFGHVDMLRHLARHAFEPAWRIRLIHLYDLWRYRIRFRDAVDWSRIEKRHAHVSTALQLVDCVFTPIDDQVAPTGRAAAPAGVGNGMPPLFQVACSDMSMIAKLRAVLDPPAWWLHGYYGVPLERSLWTCRTLQHPSTLVRWLAQRLWARAGII